MNRKHKIVVVPCTGSTLEAQSKEEWSLGYMFKVLYSTTPNFRKNAHITIDDVRTQEEYYDDEYTIEHQSLTAEEYFAQQAEVNYGYTGGYKLSNRGQ